MRQIREGLPALRCLDAGQGLDARRKVGAALARLGHAVHVFTRPGRGSTLNEELSWIYSLPGWKCEVIYNGVPVHEFDAAIDPSGVKQRYGIGPLDPTVLFCGRLCVQKAPDL